MLSDSARVGMKKDSLLVGSFILLHVGARLFSASFEIAQDGSDWNGCSNRSGSAQTGRKY